MAIHGDEKIYLDFLQYEQSVRRNSVYIPAALVDAVKRNITRKPNLVTGDYYNAVGFRASDRDVDALSYQVDTLDNPDVFYAGLVEGYGEPPQTYNRGRKSQRRGYRNFGDAAENTNFDAIFDLWYNESFGL